MPVTQRKRNREGARETAYTNEMYSMFKRVHNLDERLKETDEQFAKYLSAKIDLEKLRNICHQSDVQYDYSMNKYDLCVLLKTEITKAHNKKAQLNLVKWISGIAGTGLFVRGTYRARSLPYLEEIPLQILIPGRFAVEAIVNLMGPFVPMDRSYTFGCVAALASYIIGQKEALSKKKKRTIKKKIIEQMDIYESENAKKKI